jgi:DNA primase
VRLKKIATTRDGEFAGPCPFCGGRDRFRVQPQEGLWFCRQCSPDGRWQDAIAFVMRRDGVLFAEDLTIAHEG